MATNHYFNLYGSKPEQRIIEDLIVESIKIMGTDVYYLPNDNDQARDLLYGEDPVKKFKAAFAIEIYPSNVTEYSGEKEFFSKFGLEIRNQVSVIMSKRSFSHRVPQDTFTRPREGDLIYIPFLNGTGELYEIKFTNQTKDFFMLGRKVPYFYELELEKFKYSQEFIQTGDTEVDSIVADVGYTLNFMVELGGLSGILDYSFGEIVFQSPDLTLANATATAIVQSWSQPNNILSVTNIFGDFVTDNLIIGQDSNAQYNLVYYDTLNPNNKEQYDNEYIANSASIIIDTSENNPLGSL